MKFSITGDFSEKPIVKIDGQEVEYEALSVGCNEEMCYISLTVEEEVDGVEQYTTYFIKPSLEAEGKLKVKKQMVNKTCKECGKPQVPGKTHECK